MDADIEPELVQGFWVPSPSSKWFLYWMLEHGIIAQSGGRSRIKAFNDSHFPLIACLRPLPSTGNSGLHVRECGDIDLHWQIEIDSKFLEEQNIMDYSLLLGVHYRAPQHLQSLMSYNQRLTADGLGIVAEEESIDDEISPQGLVLVPRGSEDGSVVVGPHIRGSRLRTSSATGDEEVDLLLPGAARLQIQLGVNMPARAELIPGEEEKQMFHEVYDVVLYLGIIDILQEYNIHKKIEHAYKSIQFDSLSISAVDPTFYSRRFLEFIKKVFPPNVVAS